MARPRGLKCVIWNLFFSIPSLCFPFCWSCGPKLQFLLHPNSLANILLSQEYWQNSKLTLIVLVWVKSLPRNQLLRVSRLNSLIGHSSHIFILGAGEIDPASPKGLSTMTSWWWVIPQIILECFNKEEGKCAGQAKQANNNKTKPPCTHVHVHTYMSSLPFIDSLMTIFTKLRILRLWIQPEVFLVLLNFTLWSVTLFPSCSTNLFCFHPAHFTVKAKA